jgi:hypothetical protein
MVNGKKLLATLGVAAALTANASYIDNIGKKCNCSTTSSKTQRVEKLKPVVVIPKTKKHKVYRKTILDKIELNKGNSKKCFAIKEYDYKVKGNEGQRLERILETQDLKNETGFLNFNNHVYPVVNGDIKGNFAKAVLGYRNGRKDTIKLYFNKNNKVNLGKSKGHWSFDLDGDGIVDNLYLYKTKVTVMKEYNVTDGNVTKIVKKPISIQKYMVKDVDGNETTVVPLEKVRYDVLHNVRFVKNNPKSASLGYAMTQGKYGENVVKFMYQTNKYSENKYCIGNKENKTCDDVKFKNLEGLIVFIDKTANLSERADYLRNNFLEKYRVIKQDGNKTIRAHDLNVSGKEYNIKVDSYANTYGEKVPGSTIAVNWVLGSAIYNTIVSDYDPSVGPSRALMTARGAKDAENLKLLSPKPTLYKVIKAYRSTKNMYDAQLKASERKIREVNF